MSRLSATEAARHFSDLLNRVAEGEEIEIVRNGALVGVIAPPRIPLPLPDRLTALLEALPPVDEEFAEDLRRIRSEAGVLEDPWRS